MTERKMYVVAVAPDEPMERAAGGRGAAAAGLALDGASSSGPGATQGSASSGGLGRSEGPI